MRKYLFAMAPVVLLAGCGSGSEEVYERSQGITAFDVEDMEYAAEAPADDGGEIPVGEALPVSQIAYSYDLGYEGDPQDIKALQESHAALCRKMGESTCRVLDMRMSDTEYEGTSGALSMEVAADKALSFIDSMNDLADEGGIELTDRRVSGEDLSKQIIDVEARLASRRLLRDRLMKLLETKGGSVAELVEAERAVANVTGEIEAAERLLADMKGRVRFSDLDVGYGSDSAPLDFAGPIGESVEDFVGIVGGTIGVLIRIVAVLIPVSLFLFVLIFLLRKVGIGRLWPRRWRRSHEEAEE